jgi:protein gp37
MLDRVLRIMVTCQQHQFLLLTKRPERMAEYFNVVRFGALDRNHLWLGVSAENQSRWDKRVRILMTIAAAIRFVSVEPLLGSIDITTGYSSQYPNWIIVGGESGPKARPMHPEWARSLRDQCLAARVSFFFKQWGQHLPLCSYYDDSDKRDRALDGPNLIINNDGSVWHEYDGQPRPELKPCIMRRTGKKAAGRELDHAEWNQMPQIKS